MSPRPRPTLASERTPGYRLDTLLEASAQARLPFSEAFACYVAAEVADALHRLHARADAHGSARHGLHRDVCPRHILLTEHGTVTLLAPDAAGPPAPRGRLAYAAPEHVARLELDGRADLFGLGLVLLQLLTGHHLFEGADRFDATVHEAPGRAAADELATRLLALRPDDLDAPTRAVSAELAPVVRRALAPDRADRFPTGADLAHALREHLRRTGQTCGPAEALAELAVLRLTALRVEGGESPEAAREYRFVSGARGAGATVDEAEAEGAGGAEGTGEPS